MKENIGKAICGNGWFELPFRATDTQTAARGFSDPDRLRLLRSFGGEQLEDLVTPKHADRIRSADQAGVITEQPRIGVIFNKRVYVFRPKGEAPRRRGGGVVLGQQSALAYAKMTGLLAGLSDFDGSVLYESVQKQAEVLRSWWKHGILKIAVRKSVKMESSKSRRFCKIGNLMDPGGWKVTGVLFFSKWLESLSASWPLVGLLPVMA